MAGRPLEPDSPAARMRLALEISALALVAQRGFQRGKDLLAELGRALADAGP